MPHIQQHQRSPENSMSASTSFGLSRVEASQIKKPPFSCRLSRKLLLLALSRFPVCGNGSATGPQRAGNGPAGYLYKTIVYRSHACWLRAEGLTYVSGIWPSGPPCCDTGVRRGRYLTVTRKSNASSSELASARQLRDSRKTWCSDSVPAKP